MSTNETVSRRQFFTASVAAAAGLMAARTSLGQTVGGMCRLTPPQVEGPFYPEKDQPDKDNDLTVVKGATQGALGDQVVIFGKVTDQDCNPVANALVEIWQACYSGKYNHSVDPNPAPLDPNFQYWGKAVTDAEGKYVFKTIIPGPYPAGPGWVRPPHVHYKVTRLGYHELITQMYFAGHKLNSQDRILMALPLAQRERVIVAFNPETRQGRFDLTLRRVT